MTAARMRLGAVALGALAMAVAAGASSAEPTLGAKQGPRPNIILVVTDDQTLAAFNGHTMPYTIGSVAGQGTTFANAIAVTPLCCPSRASMITGQYGHNNGVVNNKPGYPALRDKPNVLPAWLRAAGYYTAHVGRYLNEYPHGRNTKPAPGWDEWVSALEPRRYFGYELQVGRDSVEFGKKASDYITTVLNNRATQIISKQAPKPQPFYLQLDQFAPHAGPGMPKGPCAGRDVPDALPADYAQFATEPLPTPPSFNEEDISDKPSFVRKVPLLTEKRIAAITQRYRCALGSLPAVDRGMAAIDAALAQAGELDNTVVMFVSDNGFYYGEHRLPREKIRPYEEGLRIPLAIRVPAGVLGAPVVSSVDELVANIDLTPTILDFAGAAPCIAPDHCRVMDGRSLVPLLRGEDGWPPDRGLAIEFRTADEKFNTSSSCEYHGIRTPGQLYVQHISVPNAVDGTCEPADEREHYDLAADPFELQNLYPADPESLTGFVEGLLAERSARLANCAGIEGRDPAPASGNYCE
ncbi:MAG TPA: sulfatase [Solirubrobacterales bacterium]|nr:sulfatase [Solirubrobacterales bacterium]